MPAAEYEWWLCEAPDPRDPEAECQNICPIVDAKNRSVGLTWNRPGQASFDIRTDSEAAYHILDRVDMGDVRGTVRKSVKVKRNKQSLWSGPVWGIDGQLDQNKITISCVGWFETLFQKIIYLYEDARANFMNEGNGLPADQIAYGLLAVVNAQYESLGAPLWVLPGTASGNMTILLPQSGNAPPIGNNPGDQIQFLSDQENGPNISVDPDTRQLNLTDSSEMVYRPDAKLGYKTGPGNLKTFQWQESTDKTVNSMFVSNGQAFTGPFQDTSSIQDFGNVFEEIDTQPGMNLDLASRFAFIEEDIRGRPLLTYTVTTEPKTDTRDVPALFDDFNLGDILYVSAEKDAFKIEDQPCRATTATITLDDLGNETLSPLTMVPMLLQGMGP